MRRQFLSAILLFLSGQLLAKTYSINDLVDMPIEDLLNVHIISASRLGQTTSQSPASLSVLTASDIRTFGWRTLAEALNAVRGLYSSNDRNYSYLGVRGFMHPNDYNSRVLLMIDGQRMNENIYDGGYLAQEFMLDVDLIERIEFSPGSGASIYGANAFLGLINVVTKTGMGINGTQIAGAAGSFDTYQGRISYGKKLANGADILLSASRFTSAGVENLYFPEFDDPATNNGIAHNIDAERASRMFGRITFENFTLSGGYVNRIKQVPTAAYEGIFNDPDFHTTDQQFYTNLKYKNNLTDNTSLQVKGFYQGYDYYSDQAYDDDGRVINHDAASGRWWGGEAQLTNTSIEHHRLMIGLEYQYDQRQQLLNYDIDPYLLYQDSNRHGHRLELYAQDDIQIGDEWMFSAGLRLDYHHMLNTLQLNPRLGLIWNPLASTTVKVLYSSTFRAPNAWERDYSAFGTSPNPDIHEERVKSYEGIIEWHSTTGLKLTSALFLNDITQLIEQQTEASDDGLTQFINIDDYQAVGAEFEAEQRWESGRMLKTSYTYSRLTNETDGGIWANASPQNMCKLHYAEPLFNQFATLGIETIYIGERKTPQGSLADAYNQLNLNLSSDNLLPGLDISLGIYNLLDTHYEMLGGTGPADITQDILPMNGREFRLKLKATF